MNIEKMATNPTRFWKDIRYYDRARSALGDLLKCLVQCRQTAHILLPAYIGISPKEGSGIFDPISSCQGLCYHFYGLNASLETDVADLTTEISKLNGLSFVLLRVNYFGFVDPKAKQIYELVKNANGFLIEDNAHAFFTDRNHPAKYADAAIYSLHKMFPVPIGGMLSIYDKNWARLELSGSRKPLAGSDPWCYDHDKISEICRTHGLLLEQLSYGFCDYFLPMYSLKERIEVSPQTFPILLQRGNRFKVYEIMNDAGYGVTSLYHTLIPLLRRGRYPICEDISNRVLNLPTHQDVDDTQYPKMIDRLVRAICESI